MSIDEYNEEDILIQEMSVTNINGFGSIFLVICTSVQIVYKRQGQ